MEIVEICRDTKAELKTLPGMYQLINGQVSVNHLRPVSWRICSTGSR